MDNVRFSAPFYASRYRIKQLASEHDRKRFKYQASAGVPGIGKVQIDREDQEKSLADNLERAISNLDALNMIGEVEEENCDYFVASLQAAVERFADVDAGVDHLIFVDETAALPRDWCCVLVGSRANILSISDTSTPPLGSSPLAVQEVLSRVASRTSRARTEAPSKIRLAVESVKSSSDFTWSVVGVVQILQLWPAERIVVGAPLFLSYDS